MRRWPATTRRIQDTPIGFFAPGTPMASDVGLDVFRGPRDYGKVKADLKAAGYKGEKSVLLVPANALAQKPLGDVAAECLRKAGMNVEYAGLDFGAVLQRQLRRSRSSRAAGAPAVGNLQGMDWLNPAGDTNMRGDGKVPGWYAARRWEACAANGWRRPTWPSSSASAATSSRSPSRKCPISDRPVQAADRLPQSHHRHPRRHRRLLERTPRMSTTAIFGSYVLSRKDGAQDVLRDHWVLVEGKKIAAVTRASLC